MFIGCKVIMVSTGASIEVITTCEDEPMCRHTMVFSSLHGCQNGAQWALCRDAEPSGSGCAENVPAWHAFRAPRRTSSAIRSGLQIGGNASGIIRPGSVPHHSSMCQSL